MMTTSLSSAVLPSRILLSTIGLATAFGGYFADFNETHIYNPRFTPHAKFHSGQTMTTGLGLGILTWYFTWRRTNASNREGLMDNIMIATVTASFYWLTQFTSILYPGTQWVDDEFRESHGEPQKRGAPVIFTACWSAFALAWYRLGNVTGLKAL